MLSRTDDLQTFYLLSHFQQNISLPITPQFPNENGTFFSIPFVVENLLESQKTMISGGIHCSGHDNHCSGTRDRWKQ